MSKNHSFETGRTTHGKKTILMDLDGTLADTVDYEALHKIKSEEFAQVARNAMPNAHMVSLMEEAKKQGHNVVILTARSAHYRDDTKKWLHKHGIPYDAMYMRPVGNMDKDKKLKKTILKEDILPNYDVKKAYDDKKKNVKMFRKQGIDTERVKQ